MKFDPAFVRGSLLVTAAACVFACMSALIRLGSVIGQDTDLNFRRRFSETTDSHQPLARRIGGDDGGFIGFGHCPGLDQRGAEAFLEGRVECWVDPGAETETHGMRPIFD